ncbi:MAG: helix-turn-helix transcriptional regulator [Oscillospiraceae bacterium]|nr:helix-turn-helix transcriptional regulator [Oscillospiraceae bacterium]
MTGIERIRKKQNMTQIELAKHMGVTQANVSQWESNVAKPRAENLIKMSVLFGCTIDELLKDA